jgi:hypothetical protein
VYDTHICIEVCKTAINRQQEGLVIANIDGAIRRINEMEERNRECMQEMLNHE